MVYTTGMLADTSMENREYDDDFLSFVPNWYKKHSTGFDTPCLAAHYILKPGTNRAPATFCLV